MTSYTIQDTTVVLTIKAGTEAGKEFDLECKFQQVFRTQKFLFYKVKNLHFTM